MGRLIDEQTVNEAVRKVLRKYGFSDELCVSDEIWDCIENEVPTAYDVDKVLKKLEELRHPYTTFPQGYGALNEYDYYIDKAISIVKGVDMDE